MRSCVRELDTSSRSILKNHLKEVEPFILGEVRCKINENHCFKSLANMFYAGIQCIPSPDMKMFGFIGFGVLGVLGLGVQGQHFLMKASEFVVEGHMFLWSTPATPKLNLYTVPLNPSTACTAKPPNPHPKPPQCAKPGPAKDRIGVYENRGTSNIPT